MAHRPCPFRTEQAESDINFFNSVIPLREQLQHQGRLVKISSSYSTEMVISEYPLRFRLSNFVPPQNMKHGAVEGGESPSQTQDCRRLSSAWPFLTSNQNINHTDRINMRHELKQCGIIVLYKTQQWKMHTNKNTCLTQTVGEPIANLCLALTPKHTTKTQQPSTTYNIVKCIQYIQVQRPTKM